MTLTVYCRPFRFLTRPRAIRTARRALGRGLLRLASRYGYSAVVVRRGSRFRCEGASAAGTPGYLEFELVWAEAVVAAVHLDKRPRVVAREVGR
ncbi:MAG: hypothetical protein FJX77_03035 [Armatimonadetes bacterium]|nr:hypothetical protein [Armatimonadota bacterium]